MSGRLYDDQSRIQLSFNFPAVVTIVLMQHLFPFCDDEPYDAIIVGGGPAGLSAALVLGRCRRKVLVCDVGHPRNERSKAMHGFLSRDGISPAEFAKICRDQLDSYPSVELRTVEVVHARCAGGSFNIELRGGSAESSRTLLLATGIVDELPRDPGFNPIYGRSAHHCPYCDGMGASGPGAGCSWCEKGSGATRNRVAAVEQ
jgi:thioredoxin reductase